MPVLLFLLAGCDLLDLVRPAAFRPKGPAIESAESPAMRMKSQREKFVFYKWLVTEMQEQIFARPPRNAADAGGWANVLTQSGSIEGVYHGFVLSTDYLALEQSKKPADVKALRFYGLEMALLDYPYALESDEKVQAAAAKYVQSNMTTSIYALKRELGERILREAVKRKVDAEKLAAWYSGIVARWTKLDIPFGLPQRNEKSEAFHFEWAKENTLGMLEWELLNREHRILNQLGGIAPAAAPVKAAPPAPKPVNPAGK